MVRSINRMHQDMIELQIEIQNELDESTKRLQEVLGTNMSDLDAKIDLRDAVDEDNPDALPLAITKVEEVGPS